MDSGGLQGGVSLARQTMRSARRAARQGKRSTAAWGQTLAASWRAISAPQPWSGRLPPAAGTVNTQFWVDASPWRFTAGWSFVAALLAGGALHGWQNLNWQQLVLLWLLVDPLWGALWRLAGGRSQLLPLRAGSPNATLRLPYLQPRSPAAELLSLDENNSLPWLVRVALPALIVAAIVAGVLGVSPLVFTGAAVLLTVAGWTLRRTLAVPPLLLHALLLVALPWLLTLVQIGSGPAAETWGAAVALALFWTLHAWGEARAATWPGDRIALALLAVAQVGVAFLLVVIKTPVFLPVLAVLLLPTWLRAIRSQPLGGLSGWWTAALLLSALAVGWQ